MLFRSIADNDNNKLMTGELFEINENSLKVVSLDGHRISIRNIELKNNYEHKKVVVPGKTLQEISKILPGNADEDVSMYLSDNHIVFEFGNTTVVSRLIEGEYFKIEQMLSSDYETKVKINKRELLDCIDRATLLVKEGDKKPIIMNITDDKMELKINSFIGSMNEEIDITKDGKDILIGFNPKFFIDALRVIDDEEVTSIGPLAFDLHVQRFENELFVRGNISAPFKFRCVRCLGYFDYVVEVCDFATSFQIDSQNVVDVSDSLREEIVLDFPAYPKCADGGMENDCMAKTPYFGVDKEGGTGVNSSAPIRNSGVWDALNELGDHH